MNAFFIIWFPIRLIKRLSSALKCRLSMQPFLKSIITSDKKWILYNHIQQKRLPTTEKKKENTSLIQDFTRQKRYTLCLTSRLSTMMKWQTKMEQVMRSIVNWKHCIKCWGKASLINRKGVIHLHDYIFIKSSKKKIIALNMKVPPHPSDLA